MDIHNDKIKSLVVKSITQELDKKEEKALSEWLDLDPGNKKIYKRLLDSKNISHSFSVLESIDTKKSFEKTKSKLSSPSNKNKIRKIAIVASGIAASIVLAFSLFMPNIGYFKVKNDIPSFEPGKKKAILIVDNGQEINLHDSLKINISIDNADVKIENSKITYKPKVNNAVPKMNKIITPHGGEFSVVLPDSTKVWLNAMSEIEFPSFFAGGQRVVKLKGEAFFDVSEDKDKPFIVKLSNYEVKVLGTKFNISDYNDSQKSHTTLCSGSIEIAMLKNSSEKIALTPGSQLLFNNATNTFETKEVDTELYTSWMQGYFYYVKMPLGEIAKSLSKWYEIEVKFEDDASQNRLFSAKFSRYDKLGTILKVMEEGSGLKFDIDGKTVNVR